MTYQVRAAYDVLPGVPLPWEADESADAEGITEDALAEELEEADDDEDADEIAEENDEDDASEALRETGSDDDLDDTDLDDFDMDGDEPLHIPGVYENGKPTRWAINNLHVYAHLRKVKCVLCERRFLPSELESDDHPSLCRTCNDEQSEKEAQCSGCGAILAPVEGEDDSSYCADCGDDDDDNSEYVCDGCGAELGSLIDGDISPGEKICVACYREQL